MTSTVNIWNPQTGIEDLPAGWPDIRATEIESIQKIWKEQRERLKGSKQLSEFSDKLAREWAIETGVIEGLYDIDRGVTQTLIEHGFQAELMWHGSTNQPREYVIQLLKDQRDALEGVFDFVANRRELTSSYIKEIHAALLRSQHTTTAEDGLGREVEVPLLRGDWKVQPNYPLRDGVLHAYCPPEQVASEIDRLIEMHHAHQRDGVSPEVSAAWLHHRFAQIHPFQDGNGRVARALASLVLIQAGLFPLVINRDEKKIYIDALEAADAGDLSPLISIIAKFQRAQFRRATAISENMLTADADVHSVLAGLKKVADEIHARRLEELQRVFGHSDALEAETETYLRKICPDVRAALRAVDPSANALVHRSDPSNDFFYRSQIIENAKKHFGYYADTQEYRAWVSFSMFWQRKAKLVFAFHALGRPFNGSLTCAPFLEFQDADDDGQSRGSLIRVAEEAFVFFYDEDLPKLVDRFKEWRDRVVVVALRELTLNL
ncbi:MAG: Fic family protein [Brevundimonas sp.]|uniref:Fic family protein n=1 Tax=Brevundimonas sp. TaxID=1871086 RepID=UPI0017E92BAC|nr:Fic family protein [Brevundimonas sp.]MBA4805859.1 Fic family protein [Brevundimonas sp.]